MAALRLLGGFELTGADGAPAALPTRKAQAVVARLALRPGERVSRAALAGLLWGDRPDEQGRASLRQALASIRRAAGDAVLDASGDAVALAPGAVEVDAALVDAALGRGDAARALALYRGALLAGFPPLEEDFDGWLDDARAALERRVLAAADAALEACVARGDAAGLELAERALAIDPAHEAAWRARIRLLAARGERAAALREYARCRAALARALDVEPGAETERVVRELAAAAAPATPGRGRPSLAVLPFEVLSDDPTAALFARGLGEDVVVALARFRSLDVAAPDAAARLAAEGLDAAQVGATLDAGHVLRATVRAGGSRLRVSAHLVDSRSGREAWADRFEGELADVFGLQDRIVRAIASALALELDGGVLREAARRPPEALDAYACWVRGMERLRSGAEGADLEARRLFERALAVDPGFARAYVGLSLSHFNDWSCVAWERWDENERRAHDYAAEALRLDDRDHVAHLILGRVLLYRREFDRGAAHLARSLALNDNDPDALAHLALGHAYLGETARAVELGGAAQRLNPLHPDWYLPCAALGLFLAGRPADALALAGRAPDGFVDTRALLAAAAAAAGDLDAAAEHARRYLARFRGHVAKDPRADGAAAVAWLLRVNPLRREEDRAALVGGLARAGLRA